MTPSSTNRSMIAMLDTLIGEYLQGKDDVLRLALIALLTGEIGRAHV